MSHKANWNYPTAVKFGVGRSKELADHCRTLNMQRPLLVTDAGLAQTPMVHQVLVDLLDAGLAAALFSDIRPNPSGANLDAGVRFYRAGGHDGVIAFGGGSGIDTGKLIAFMSGQTRSVWDFEDIGDWWTRANPAGIAPIIAVPTTAGTGSEVGRAGVVTDEATHTKRIIFHPKIMPSIVICDAQLSVGMPAKITAGTGMDALSHCLEAYCAPGFHPLADGVAVEGMRLIATALPKVMADPNDLNARADMLAAAAMGATAFQKGLGGMHALSHPIGALFDTHHGMTNACLMPYVLAYNRSAIESRLTRLAAYLELPDPGFDSFLRYIVDLRQHVGVPNTLIDLGIDPARSAEIAAKAVLDPSAGGNPVTFDLPAALQILSAAFAGDI